MQEATDLTREVERLQAEHAILKEVSHSVYNLILLVRDTNVLHSLTRKQITQHDQIRKWKFAQFVEHFL